jgi:hypothetical protein
MNFDANKYKVWTWKNPLVLHWILNPGLAINELVLGQAVPKVTLIEKSNKPLTQRSFVPCPHCGTVHSALKWSPQNKTAFGNWFGLYCDNCGNIIPCVRNITSLILLGVTFPIWVCFRKGLEKKWLLIQKEKFSKPLSLTTPEFNWVTQGLSWGFFMFLFMDIIFPLFDDEGYKPLKLIVGVIVWTLTGLLFGYTMKKLMFKKLNKTSQDKTQQAA